MTLWFIVIVSLSAGKTPPVHVLVELQFPSLAVVAAKIVAANRQNSKNETALRMVIPYLGRRFNRRSNTGECIRSSILR